MSEPQLNLVAQPRGGHSIGQVEHHVRDKFATPVLYGIDTFTFYDICSAYT